MLGITENQDMKAEIKNRIEQIRQGKVPADYKKTKHGIFPKEWEIGPVGDLIQEYKSFSNDIESMPVYSSSRNGLIRQAEYYDRKESQKTNLGYKVVPPEYVTYRHMSDDDIFHFNINTTGESILVSAEYPVFRSNGHSDLNFLIPLLNNSSQFRYFCRTQKLGGTRTRLYFRVLETYEIVAPCLEEQQEIAKILMTQDRVIALREKLLAEKLRQKQYLMQVLLTGKKRLPGFSEKWKLVHLKDLCAYVRRRSVNSFDTYVNNENISSNLKGTVHFGEERNEVAGMEYRKGDILIGNIRPYLKKIWLADRDGICSPDILVLRPSNISSSCMYNLIATDTFFSYMMTGAGGSKMPRGDKKQVMEYPLQVPQSVKEQDEISHIFSLINEEIELLEQVLIQERWKKKALMQLLLSGIVRVKP